MKNKLFSFLKFLIGWPLSILALFFIIKIVAPQAPQFFSHLHEVSLPLLALGFLSFLIYYFIRGYIWKRMLKQSGYHISYKEMNFIWASSEVKRYIPGNIWSFLGRSVLLHEHGMNKKDIARVTLFEIEFIVFGSLLVSLLALPFLTHYFAFPTNLSNLLIFLCLAGVFVYAFLSKLHIKLFFLPDYQPIEILLLIIFNAGLFFFFGLGYFFTFASFISIDSVLILQLTGISVLAYLIGYLSIITPSGIGVREGALVFALSKIMSQSTAGFVALFGRFVLIIAEIIYVVISYIWHQLKQ